MDATHLREVREIEKEAGFTLYSESYWLSEIASLRSRAFVAERAEPREVIGYIHAWFVAGEMQITEVAVKKNWRRKGIATMLIEKMMERAREEGIKRAYLEVRVGNEAALNLYRKMGFLVLGRRENYYRETGGEAGYLMEAII